MANEIQLSTWINAEKGYQKVSVMPEQFAEDWNGSTYRNEILQLDASWQSLSKGDIYKLGLCYLRNVGQTSVDVSFDAGSTVSLVLYAGEYQLFRFDPDYDIADCVVRSASIGSLEYLLIEDVDTEYAFSSTSSSSSIDSSSSSSSSSEDYSESSMSSSSSVDSSSSSSSMAMNDLWSIANWDLYLTGVKDGMTTNGNLEVYRAVSQAGWPVYIRNPQHENIAEFTTSGSGHLEGDTLPITELNGSGVNGTALNIFRWTAGGHMSYEVYIAYGMAVSSSSSSSTSSIDSSSSSSLSSDSSESSSTESSSSSSSSSSEDYSESSMSSSGWYGTENFVYVDGDNTTITNVAIDPAFNWKTIASNGDIWIESYSQTHEGGNMSLVVKVYDDDNETNEIGSGITIVSESGAPWPMSFTGTISGSADITVDPGATPVVAHYRMMGIDFDKIGTEFTIV